MSSSAKRQRLGDGGGAGDRSAFTLRFRTPAAAADPNAPPDAARTTEIFLNTVDFFRGGKWTVAIDPPGAATWALRADGVPGLVVVTSPSTKAGTEVTVAVVAVEPPVF